MKIYELFKDRQERKKRKRLSETSSGDNFISMADQSDRIKEVTKKKILKQKKEIESQLQRNKLEVTTVKKLLSDIEQYFSKPTEMTPADFRNLLEYVVTGR